jgi:hypothetical protein
MSIDVLEECVASIFRDEEYGKLETSKEASIKENPFLWTSTEVQGIITQIMLLIVIIV